MDKYYQKMQKIIATEKDIASWRQYHYQRVAEFQHERLIHLMVTLFFGLLLLCFIGLLLGVATLGSPTLTGLSASLVLLVGVTEAFYIVHYYKLENGVQRLYELTDKLGRL